VKRWRAEAALVLNTLIWGSTFVIVKEALQGVSTILFLRYVSRWRPWC